MKKQLFSAFLLLVLITQMLPLRQIGSVLFSNQINEELPHSMDIDKGCFKKNTQYSDYLTAIPMAAVSVFIDFSYSHHSFADRIPQNPAGEILVPPPNY